MLLRELFEGYREAQAEFAQAADAEQAQRTIAAYRDLVNRNQVSGPERNIDYWRKQGWEKFSQFVERTSGLPSTRAVKRGRVAGNAITVRDDGEWLIVVPLDKNASCFHGRNTDWCTTKADAEHFEKYFYQNQITLIYCIRPTTGEKWAIAGHPDVAEIEMFDREDRSMGRQEFKRQTGLDPIAIAQQVHENYAPTIRQARHDYRQQFIRAQQLVDSRKLDRSQELDQLFSYLKNSEFSLHYMEHNGVGTYPAAIILSATKEDAAVIENAENISSATLRTIARDDPSVLKWVRQPIPVEIQREIFEDIPIEIRFIRNPDISIQRMAIEYDPGMIKFINNPSGEIELMAIKADPYTLQDMDSPSSEAQVLAVTIDPFAIRFVRNQQASAAQVAALRKIKQSGPNVAGFWHDYIRQPSPSALYEFKHDTWDQIIRVAEKVADEHFGTFKSAINSDIKAMREFVDSINSDDQLTPEARAAYPVIKKFLDEMPS